MKTIKLPIIITLAMLVGLLAFASVKPVSAATAPSLSQTTYNMPGIHTGNGGAIFNGSGTPTATVVEGNTWLKVTIVNNQTYSIEVQQNNTGKSRTGKFQITVSGTKLSATVNQAAYKASDNVTPSTPTESTLEFRNYPSSCDYYKPSFTVSFYSKYAWKASFEVPNTNDPYAEPDYGYVSKSSGSGSALSQSVNFTLPTNYSKNSRTVKVTIESNGKKITRSIIQAGAPRTMRNLSGFEKSSYRGYNDVTSFMYAYGCDISKPYTVTSCSFDALDSWKVLYTFGGVDVDRKTGSNGHQVLWVKLPKGGSSNNFGFVLQSGQDFITINYTYALYYDNGSSYWPGKDTSWEDFVNRYK